MDGEIQDGASRRNVLKTGALGMGAFATVMGVGAVGESGAEAAVPRLGAASGAPVDLFLKLDGVEGEATDRDHKGEIALLSFSWGASNAGAAGGGGGAGKVTLSDIQFSSTTSKASPKLFLACATGQHIKQGLLSVRRRSGKAAAAYIKLLLSEILVSTYQTAGASTVPTDAFSLNFQKLTYTVYPVSADGRPGTPVTASWDVEANRGG